MDISEKVAALYEKDTKTAYQNLLELEEISRQSDTVYQYLDEFMAMLKSDKYAIRVRGFRLICLQAKWDKENKIDAAIEEILGMLNDEKPTAVRQALQYLGYTIPCKPGLKEEICRGVQAIDLPRFKTSVSPLILKDITEVLALAEDE